MPNKNLTDSIAWKSLQAHQKTLQNTHMRDLFAQNKNRFNQFHIELDGFLFDYSKHRITAETIELLIDLAQERDLKKSIRDMIRGAKINTTENRAALHMALRNSIQSKESSNFVKTQLKAIKILSEKIRADKNIQAIVHIGTGGSDLGPRMICEALAQDGPTAYFVNNADAADITGVLKNLKPESTLFILVSKSFSTAETLLNAVTGKKWLMKNMDEQTSFNHFYAITENITTAKQWGIDPAHILPLQGWIGGRFSLWSAVGLSIAVACGFEKFRELLNGAAAMDKHFLETPFDKNIPVLMALLGIWYRNFWDFQAHAVVPYAQALDKFPDYIRQLEMESNGKSTDKDGRAIGYATAPVIIGDVGTNGQHAFFQSFHQGSGIVPMDIIVPLVTYHDEPAHHTMLVSNALAQGEALMKGSDNEEQPHRHFDGNRPSSTFLLDCLDAYHLRMLIAAYEHKVFVQGAIWNINSFDQWGVELGKTLASQLIQGFESGKSPPDLDSSTAALFKKIRGK